MITTQVELYVKKKFSMGLREFIKEKTEVEKLYDYEIAGIINADSLMVGKLRKNFGIKKAVVFPRQFELNYGEGAVERFKKIIEKPDKSLADVARHFGFCREYARQVYLKIYGCPYTETYRVKLVKKKQGLLDGRIKPKRIRLLIEAREKMESNGMTAHLRILKHGHETWINGYKLVMRSTSKSVMTGRKRYFRIGNKTNSDYNFMICACKDNGNTIHYVIPRHAMPKSGIYLIPEAGLDGSKYSRFKEAWHLLARTSC